MEVAMEVEDDVFFADLNKQISRLIMEDDEVHDPVKVHSPSVSLQAFTRGIHTAPPLVSIAHQQTSMMRRESKGTGVFIPQSLHPSRRKSRRGRFSSSSNTKLQRQSDHHNPRGKLPLPTSFTNNTSHTSFNLHKC